MNARLDPWSAVPAQDLSRREGPVTADLVDEERREHPRDFAEVCSKISELADDLVGEEATVRARRRADFDSVFPGSSLGSGGGGPTNRRHNFDTGEDNPSDGSGVPVPQHSDPTGEAAVRDLGADELGRALRRSMECVCQALRDLEAARGLLARTRRPEVTVEQRDRVNCWPCLEVGVRSEVFRDNAPNGVGNSKPRCRRHYEYFLSTTHEAPCELAVWWVEGRRVTSSMVEVAEEAELARKRGAKGKKTKKGRR